MKPNLETRIERVLEQMPHGWCSVRKAHALAAIIMATRPERVVEIGVYAGRSFVPMVMALHEAGHGVAHGIDPYDAKVSAAGEEDANREWWGNLDHEQIYRFAIAALESVKEWQDHWILWRQSSDEMEPSCVGPYGLLHVDGAHTEQAYRDVQRYAPLVEPGGFVVLDDILWSSGEVSRSIEVLESLGFVERFRVIGEEPGTRFTDNWGVFQRVG